MSYELIRRSTLDRMSIDAFARTAGLHPDLIRRLVTLGLLEPQRDSTGSLWFARGQLARVATIQRLRSGLSVNYAALGLVLDLLDRVAALETALRRATRHTGDPRWT
jgi:DNA-binding transcriptional MerR regulator